MSGCKHTPTDPFIFIGTPSSPDGLTNGDIVSGPFASTCAICDAPIVEMKIKNAWWMPRMRRWVAAPNGVTVKKNNRGRYVVELISEPTP